MDFLELALLVTIIIILIVAIICQIKDQDTLDSIPYVNTLPVEDQRKALENLSCYEYNNGIAWRYIYFCSIIVAFIGLYVLPGMFSLKMFFLMLLIIFTVFYVFTNMIMFHSARVVCSRAKGNDEFVVSP